MKSMGILMIVSIIIFLVANVNADEGTATYYNPPYTPSACYGYKDHGEIVAAGSNAIWNDGKACGQIFSAKCIGATNLSPNPCLVGEVYGEIVDYCPNCTSTINLSRQAFSIIADPSAGRIKIEYYLE